MTADPTSRRTRPTVNDRKTEECSVFNYSGSCAGRQQLKALRLFLPDREPWHYGGCIAMHQGSPIWANLARSRTELQ